MFGQPFDAGFQQIGRTTGAGQLIRIQLDIDLTSRGCDTRERQETDETQTWQPARRRKHGPQQTDDRNPCEQGALGHTEVAGPPAQDMVAEQRSEHGD